MNSKDKKIYFIFITAIALLVASLVAALYLYLDGTRKAGSEIAFLEEELEKIKEEDSTKNQVIEEYNILTDNLNKLMSTVYFGSAVSDDEHNNEKNFTAFSMYYNENFYLITAGHCVEYDGVKYTGFKFKSNTYSVWLYPELLYYENDYHNNRDYAIFYHPNLRTGLIVSEYGTEPKYVLGNIQRKINFIKEFNTAENGESGSPILNSGCKLVGVVIKSNNDYTPVEIITEKIEELRNLVQN